MTLQGEQKPIQDIYKTSIDWIKTFCTEKEISKFYQQVYPIEPLRENIANCPMDDNYHYPKYSSGAYITKMNNGRVWGNQASVITPDNKLLYDVSSDLGIEFSNNHDIFKLEKLPPAQYMDKTVSVVAHPGNYNYYHWMFQILPRFDVLQKSGIKIDKFIIQQSPLAFHNETLNVLKISKKEIIKCHPKFHIKAKQLIIPSLPTNLYPTKWACNFLRKTFLTNSNSVEGYDRIFIRRNNTRHRHIINEQEVIDTLTNYGFKAVNLEDKSVSEQINIFKSCSVIVAPHGAGLTNLVFCSPGTKVFELLTSSYPLLMYWLISNYNKLEYHYSFEQNIYNPASPVKGDDDMRVDCKRLIKILNKAGVC